MRDLYSNIGAVIALPAATYNADAAGAVIDTLGFGSVAFALSVGVGGINFTGTNKVEFVLEHSDDGSAFEVVPADEVLGVAAMGADGIVKALKAAHADPSVTRFGYIGDRRYLRLTADFSGTHGTGTPISAVAILGRPHSAPVA